jgi:hypothetical protein
MEKQKPKLITLKSWLNLRQKDFDPKNPAIRKISLYEKKF